ncbi:MAG: extracellular solute-binding protein [Nocardiaceae bacterium]|nr:extracellular solute-binding protein [Nocardiaceae bacterium]
MHITRTITVLAAATLVGAGLAGCSSSASTTGNAASGPVSYMTWESNQTNAALDATMKKFSASSKITVTREEAPNADYAQKLASLIMAKKAPDFFWCTTAEAQNLAAEGLLYDWSSKLDSGDGLKAANFSPGSLAMWKTPDGKLSGIPTLANTYGFFYNADAFTAAGLQPPKIGWTWDDLFTDIQKLKAANPKSTPLVNQWALLESPQGVSAYSVANGGQPFVDSFVHAKTVQADPTLLDGFNKFAAAIKSGEMSGPDYDATNAMAAFSNGNIPLMFGGQWLQQSIAPNKPKFNWGYAPWPAGSVSSVQPIEANGVCSPVTMKNPDATWKAISYMESTGFNDVMKTVPVAPIAYEPGSAGYYENLQSAGDPASLSIEATAKYELGAKDKFITQFLDDWATKAGDIVTTSWNPALSGKTSGSAGVDATVSGIKGLIGK